MFQQSSGNSLIDQLQLMKKYFKTNATKSFSFRKKKLSLLKKSILKHEEDLYNCLYADLKKNKEEAWITEIGFVVAEINYAIKNLYTWINTKKVSTNLANFPSSSFIMPGPLGVVLIIGPWNYPLQLLFNPLVGAIAAGNCVVLKPSEFAGATSYVMKKIIEDVFNKEYIFYVEGEGAIIIPQMMNNFIFDHVFYTGSTSTGKIIYKMAAENLVPVTLELGGKSPCIIEDDANIKVAAKRIAVTKFSNAGQMCVAPDYLLVHSKIKNVFVDNLISTIKKFFTENVSDHSEYAKIINEKKFDRLISYLNSQKIIYGGKYNREKLFIGPTIIEISSLKTELMKEEIFGPILPVISFNSDEEAKKIIEQNPNPLALYVYTSSKQKEKYWLTNIEFGGGCINNSSWHLTNYNLPFGGIGTSGIGKYHGKYSFETFSHFKAIMKTPTWFDPSIRYPPLKGKLKLFKRIIR